MKLQVQFTVDVEFVDTPDGYTGEQGGIEDSVAEAITEAISAAENRGFSHRLEDQISITFDRCVDANF